MKLYIKGAWRECQVMPAPQGTFAFIEPYSELATPVFLFIAEPDEDEDCDNRAIEGCLIDGEPYECDCIANLFELCHVYRLMETLKNDPLKDRLHELNYTLNLLKERNINISDEARVQFGIVINRLNQEAEETKDEV